MCKKTKKAAIFGGRLPGELEMNPRRSGHHMRVVTDDALSG
jgi:hypothetical protein